MPRHNPDSSRDSLLSTSGSIEEEEKSHPNTKSTSIIFSHLLPGAAGLLSAANESWQFNAGLIDMNDSKLLGFIKLSPGIQGLIAILFTLQSTYFGYTSTQVGVKKLLEQDWEKLPTLDAIKANGSSFFINLYTILSDSLATAFYLGQQGYGISKTLELMVGIFIALSSFPTENLETHAAIREYFSTLHDTLTIELNKIHQSDFYTQATPEFQKTFDAYWEMLSIQIKLSLLKDKTIDKKSDYTAMMFSILGESNNPLTNSTTIKNALLGLKIDDAVADQYADEYFKLSQLRYSSAQNQSAPHQNNGAVAEAKDSQETGTMIYEFLKKGINATPAMTYALIQNIAKACGSFEDMGESYASVLQYFLITNPWFQSLALVGSIANGINDWSFYGANSSRILDEFSNRLQRGNFGAKEIGLFLLSLFTGSIVGHAQFKLMLDMLTDDNTIFPFFLPRHLPQNVAMGLALGAAFRELLYYTDNFWSLYSIMTDSAEQIYTSASRRIQGDKFQIEHEFPTNAETAEENGDGWVEISCEPRRNDPIRMTREWPDDWQVIARPINTAVESTRKPTMPWSLSSLPNLFLNSAATVTTVPTTPTSTNVTHDRKFSLQG